MRYLFIPIFSILTICLHAQDYIYNLSFQQEGNKIVVDYQLAPLEDGQYYKVYLKFFSAISGDKIKAKSVSGDYGKTITAGKKQIIWEVLDDVASLKEEIEIEITAHLYGEEDNSPIIITNENSSEIKWSSDKKGSFTDERDGEKYEVVKIGNQVWMAENLRYKAEGSWYNPNNPSKKYGRLYDWATVMNIDKKYNYEEWGGSEEKHQGICPKGWHIPTDEEWNFLEIALGMAASDASKRDRGRHGRSIRSIKGWKRSGNGDNSSGFNAFPAGGYYYENGYSSFGVMAYFCSATNEEGEPYASNAWGRTIYENSLGVIRNSSHKLGGQSCRCLQD